MSEVAQEERLALLAQANRLREGRQWQAAVDVYERLIRDHPLMLEAHVGRAACIAQYAPQAQIEDAWRALTVRFPKTPRPWTELARCLRNSADAQAARLELLALRDHPAARAAAERSLAQLMLAEGQRAPAAAHLEAAIEAGDASLDTLQALGETYEQLERQADALAVCRRALALKPDALKPALCLLRSALALGQVDTAFAQLREMAARGMATPATARSVLRAFEQTAPREGQEALRTLAGEALETAAYAHLVPQALHGAGESDQAIETALRLGAQFPESGELRLFLAKLLGRAQRHEEAAKAWRAVVQGCPDDEAGRAQAWRARMELARCLRYAADAASARKELCELSELSELSEPGAHAELRATAERSLAHLELSAGRLEAACTHLRAAIAAGDAGLDTLQMLAEAYQRLGRHTDAMEQCRRALHLKPDAQRPCLCFIESALRLGEREAVFSLLQDLSAKRLGTPALAQGVLRAFEQHAPQDGLQALQLLAGDALESQEYAHLLPQALFARGELQAAFKEIVRLQARHPDSEELLLMEARLLSGAHLHEEAERAWAAALARLPGHPLPMAWAEISRVTAGRAQGGGGQLTERLRAEPGNAVVLKAALRFASTTRRWRSVAALARALLRTGGANPAELMLTLNDALRRLGQEALPVEDIRSALRKTSAWNLLDRLEREERRAAAAREHAAAGVGTAEPIDAVYMWVDGADPAWLEKFGKHTGYAPSASTDAAQNWARYDSHEEIRFSLRTLERHVPHLRNIYIVTDQQRFHLTGLPAGLRQRIRFVDHREIIPSQEVALPTFSSDVISAFLHNIPGLSENFLCLNDDTFLGAPWPARDRVSAEGLPVVDLIRQDWPADLELAQRRAAQFGDSNAGRTYATLRSFERRYGYVPAYRDTHQARVASRSLCRRTLELFREEWAVTLFPHRIRVADSPRVCVMRDCVGIHEKRIAIREALPWEHESLFGEISWEHIGTLLSARPARFCMNVSAANREQFDFLAGQFLLASHEVLPVPQDAFCLAAQSAAGEGTDHA